MIYLRVHVGIAVGMTSETVGELLENRSGITENVFGSLFEYV